MRELRYKTYHLGSAGGEWTSGTLKDLLFAMPGLLDGLIPPLVVLNDLLHNGLPSPALPDGLPDGKVQFDAGMSGGCAWKPFEISEAEYDDLVLELLTEPGCALRELEPPPSVATLEQWLRWKLNQRGSSAGSRQI